MAKRTLMSKRTCANVCVSDPWRTRIEPDEYQLAESTYDGEAYSTAVELGVTLQVLRDYQTLLERHITGMADAQVAA